MADCVYIADRRYYEAIQQAFGKGRIILPSVPCASIAEPVSGHPDMVLYSAGKGLLVCAPEVYEAYERILSPFGVNLVQGERSLSVCYPEDIAYNVLCAGHVAFALWEKTDGKIQELIKQQGISMYRTTQGYARCSALSFADCLISADPSLCQAAEKAGFCVLQIAPGNILLPGYPYGFIGGATGIMEENTVAFFGDLSLHPEGERIRSFIQKRGFSV
ncbi:MAG: hypothetical protein IKL80_05165, partial [Clostridia bacterium]|nr:hypothetical protein [Clostridia bacterium]